MVQCLLHGDLYKPPTCGWCHLFWNHCIILNLFKLTCYRHISASEIACWHRPDDVPHVRADDESSSDPRKNCLRTLNSLSYLLCLAPCTARVLQRFVFAGCLADYVGSLLFQEDSHTVYTTQNNVEHQHRSHYSQVYWYPKWWSIYDDCILQQYGWYMAWVGQSVWWLDVTLHRRIRPKQSSDWAKQQNTLFYKWCMITDEGLGFRVLWT